VYSCRDAAFNAEKHLSSMTGISRLYYGRHTHAAKPVQSGIKKGKPLGLALLL